MGPWLWLGGLLGALLTAIYSFRLVFVVFFGEAKTEPDGDTGWRMAVPLTVLCGLALIGGYFIIPVRRFSLRPVESIRRTGLSMCLSLCP